jgi:DNA repair exonuclease SbcCD nuclease subunit
MRPLRVKNYPDSLYAYAAHLKEGEKGYSKQNLIHFNQGKIFKDFDESFLYWFQRFELKYSEEDASQKAFRNAKAEEEKYNEMLEYLQRVKADTEGYNKFLELKKMLAKKGYEQRGKRAAKANS